VPTPDFDHESDSRFEASLRQFRPLAVETPRIETPGRATRRSLTLAAWAAAAAVFMLIALPPLWRPRAGRTLSRVGAGNAAEAQHFGDSQPPTIGSANALLNHASSVRAALDLVPFHPPSTQLPKGKQSALAVLSEDKDKL
jgi:hypothetical protein